MLIHLVERPRNLIRVLSLILSAVASLAVSSSGWGQDKVPAKTNKWETSAAAGLTLTKGNSDTLLATISIVSLRKWERDEVSLGADGAYGETTGLKTTEAAHGFAQYNHLFSDRFYGYARADLLHDSIADVEYRLTVGPGVGYYFIKNPTTRLSLEGGPSLIWEKQGGREKTYLAGRLAERFEHKLSDHAKVWQSAEYLPQLDDLNNYLLIGEVGAEASLTQKFSLRAYLQHYYDNEPSPGRRKNDTKLVAALAYKF